tara:strand:- start:1204 stop:2607 length:1404 start_codon:yes stop_codon:yes gene_type:complete
MLKIKKSSLVFLYIVFNSLNSQNKEENIFNMNLFKYTLQPGLFEMYEMKEENNFSATFFLENYLNTNLPNFENNNGNYFRKGYGYISSILYQFNSKFIYLSIEPRLINYRYFDIETPSKEELFGVLNDASNPSNNKYSNFINSGVKLKYKSITIGRGNWNNWWGPGIHNSLTVSNNAQGMYKNYFSISNDKNTIEYKIKYEVSDPMKNIYKSSYFITSSYIDLKYKSISLGLSRNIFSGGHPDIKWTKKDAAKSLFSNIEYWDSINSYYIKYASAKPSLEVFLELGNLNNYYENNDNSIYPGHTRGSNIGLKKVRAFNTEYLFYGFEYTRLINSLYYNIIPSPNWYDNIKLNYSSYKNIRWSAHSGSDSDDLLLFIGIQKKVLSLIYGFNYERHGVNFHYPPEVKFENRIDLNYRINNYIFLLKYENEKYEHYGFVDNNINVWNETYEDGSVQRSKSILFSLIYKFN